MKSSAVILALPALAAAAQPPAAAAAGMANLIARQQATTSEAGTSPSATQDSQSACASSYSSLYSSMLTAPGAPPYPSAVDDFYDELRRTATTDFVCAYGTAVLPTALSSMEDAWQSSMESFLDSNKNATKWLTETPPQCSEAWLSVAGAAAEMARSQGSSCRSAASAARATATRVTNATSSATGTASSSAVVPSNTGAAGRNGVSAGLAVGAAAMVGYLGMA